MDRLLELLPEEVRDEVGAGGGDGGSSGSGRHRNGVTIERACEAVARVLVGDGAFAEVVDDLVREDGPAAKSPSAATRSKSAGDAAFAAGKYAEAVGRYTEAARHASETETSRGGGGGEKTETSLLAVLGNRAAALLKLAGEEEEVDENNELGGGNRAAPHDRKGLWDRRGLLRAAERDCTRAIALSRERSAKAWLRRGAARVALGNDIAAATSDLRRAVQLLPAGTAARDAAARRLAAAEEATPAPTSRMSAHGGGDDDDDNDDDDDDDDEWKESNELPGCSSAVTRCKLDPSLKAQPGFKL